MNTEYTYFLLLAGSLFIPLALSFDKKVSFYRKWKFLFPALILPAVFYIAWDVLFTALGVWSFNPDYVSGSYLFNLPVEEVLFFWIVPYCCVFIYECVRSYFPKLQASPATDKIFLALGFLLLIAAIIFYRRIYSCFAFGLCGLFILLIMMVKPLALVFNTKAFLISYAIILVPFLIVNGLLTRLPVVIYNNSENTGLRIGTVPVEDVFYGMLLIMMNVVIYDWLKRNASKQVNK